MHCCAPGHLFSQEIQDYWQMHQQREGLPPLQGKGWSGETLLLGYFLASKSLRAELYK